MRRICPPPRGRPRSGRACRCIGRASSGSGARASAIGASLGGDHNAAKLTRDTGGFIIGADAPSMRSAAPWRFGVAGGYTDDSLKVANRQSSGDYQSIFGALYGGASFGAIDLKAGAVAATTRHPYEPRHHLPGLQRRGELELWRLGRAGFRRDRLHLAFPRDALVLRAGPLRA